MPKITRLRGILAGVAVLIGLSGCQTVSFNPNPILLKEVKPSEEVKSQNISGGTLTLTAAPRIGGAEASHFAAKEESLTGKTPICKAGLPVIKGNSCYAVVAVSGAYKKTEAKYELEGEGFGTFGKVESETVKSE